MDLSKEGTSVARQGVSGMDSMRTLVSARAVTEFEQLRTLVSIPLTPWRATDVKKRQIRRFLHDFGDLRAGASARNERVRANPPAIANFHANSSRAAMRMY